MEPESRLKELSAEGREELLQRNKDLEMLFRSLKVNGLKGEWRIEKEHPLGVFKPGYTMAIGDWYKTGAIAPVPDGYAIAKQVMALINKFYPVNRARTKTWGAFQSQYHFTNGKKIVKVTIHKKSFMADKVNPYGKTENLITYIEVYYSAEEEAWKQNAARYLGTQQWFLDKPVHHQKDYLTKKPHSRFKDVHEEHKQELETEAETEHTERYTRAQERLKERLNR